MFLAMFRHVKVLLFNILKTRVLFINVFTEYSYVYVSQNIRVNFLYYVCTVKTTVPALSLSSSSCTSFSSSPSEVEDELESFSSGKR